MSSTTKTAPAAASAGSRTHSTAITVAFCMVGSVVVGQLYVTIPLIPRLASAWEVSAGSAAWATSAFAIAYAFGSLISGPLSQRHGRRAVMVGSIAAMAVVTSVVPLAADLTAGSLLRAAQGLLAGAFVPMAYAHLNATVPATRLPTALTMISASMGGTVVLGQVEAQLIDSVLGWRAVFWGTAPLLVVAAVVVRRVMGRPGPAPAGPSPYSHAFLLRTAPLYLITLLVAGSITAVYTGVQLYGPAALVGDNEAMLVLRISALPALVGAVLLARTLTPLPIGVRLFGAFALSTVAMTVTAFTADSPLGIGVSLFLFMLAMSTAGPALVQSVGAGAGAAPTTAIAVYGFVLNAGGGAGARLPAALPGLTGLAALLAAILATASAYLLRAMLRQSSRDSAA